MRNLNPTRQSNPVQTLLAGRSVMPTFKCDNFPAGSVFTSIYGSIYCMDG